MRTLSHLLGLFVKSKGFINIDLYQEGILPDDPKTRDQEKLFDEPRGLLMLWF